MSDKHTEALIRASGFYLSECLTEKMINDVINEENIDIIDSFIERNKWVPFEYYSVDFIYEQIEQLANSFEELMM